MKKFTKLLLTILIVFMVIPSFIPVRAGNAGKAEGEETLPKEKDKINVYFFRGQGCGFCANAEEFFKKIEEEYGKYYNLVDYETWYSSENAELLEEVRAELGETGTGVPFIIIGKKTFDGFDEERMGEAIKEAIIAEYENDNRYDIIKIVNAPDKSAIIVAIVSVILIGGFVALIIFARKQ